MSIQNVINLVKIFESNSEFRKECFSKTPEEFIKYLTVKKFVFDFYQMEDSLRLSVLNAQNYEESCHLFGIYDVIRVMLDWPSFEFEVPQAVPLF